ncbi:MAG TPA: leucyl/phenylalanyl-tRNA--protein transferase [Alphaproteobacteria bacterium]|nr:leucyl/phenylalanyl-tRNA--protein transferase [Alphaproteobacteria bacterium]HAJ48288.1 leucyl/phenylalanyl-tRNA--protein transferase [Alphaproteobacteria bacterium]
MIDPEQLLAAYAQGYFPMARSARERKVEWIDPDFRGIIPLADFHVPRRLARTVRQDQYQVKPDTAFKQVMQHCAEPMPGRMTTWINRTIFESYCRLHALGHAHSIEVWDGETLVGGLYGVKLGAAFFGESMFSRRTDVSKIALVHLVARLLSGGFLLLDTQFQTEHLSQFGTQEIPREAYLERLQSALTQNANFYELGAAGAAVSGRAVLQLITQTS